MIFGILTLITALAISAVAIYYSVAGLMAIFAAAALPIMIMGGTLEIAKLVTAVWLHKYWSRAAWWLKAYLSVAVVVLMFITSMGIFGFLSSAHIEQTSASTESVARVESITSEIDRQTSIIERAETRVRQLESSGTGSDANVQSQIDKEQERIDNAYERINPAIAEQNTIIASVTALFQGELDRIDSELAALQNSIDVGDIAKAQAMVGAKADGDFGPATARAFTAWQDAKRAERGEWLQKIQDAAQSPTVVAARTEISRLRSTAEQQIADSNTLINRLRNQLGTTDNAAQIQTDVDAQQERIKLATIEIDVLTDERIKLEAEYRKLEAEVGPIKYIAEFVYGDTADTNMLEEAVRWVIIIIIFVFDPLAVLLLIAAQYTFEFRKKELKDEDGGRLRLERVEYERARAQRIVENPGYNPGTIASRQENNNVDSRKIEEIAAPATVGASDNGRDNSGRMALAREEDLNDTNRIDEKIDSTEHESVGEVLSEEPITTADATDVRLEQTEVQFDRPAETIEPVEKKELKSPEELKREAEYDLKEQDAEFQVSKTAWKEAHPDQTLKHYKNLYVKGLIDSLPWERPAQEDNYNTSEGYQQNAEQNERTLFNKLSKK